MDVLRADIDSKQFKKVYLLCGEEAYLKNQWRDNLVSALIADGDTMNLTRYEGKNPDIPEMISMAQTLPFLAPKRVLVIENTGLFKTACETLSDCILNLPDTTCMIFVDSDVDKRTKMYKDVKRTGYVAELNTPNDNTLVTWLVTLCKREGKRMDKKTASYMLEQCGSDMFVLSNEMEKLFSYTYDRPCITMSDVSDVCVSQVTGKMFEMIDAITQGRREIAVMLYRDLLSLKEPPLRILSLLTRQIRILTEIKGMITDDVSYRDLASKAGVPPFSVKKYVNQAKTYAYSDLLLMYEACQDTEGRIKSGMLLDTIGVELLIVDFSKQR